MLTAPLTVWMMLSQSEPVVVSKVVVVDSEWGSGNGTDNAADDACNTADKVVMI
jgi:hypothetical protein